MNNQAECSIVNALLDLVGSEAFSVALIKVSSLYKFVFLLV
jgi:hypothetical protein